MRYWLYKCGFLLFAFLALPAQAQDFPDISPSLKKMLGGLPIADIKDDMAQLVGSLKKTSCGGGLTGCYATKSGVMQLYFFTSSKAQQTFVLVVDKKMALPSLLKDNVQKVLGGTALAAPIISVSTTDFTLDTVKMPADLQKIVRDNYFNVSSLNFASGVQLSARANLGGLIRATMEAFGVKGDELTLRAAVVMPIPTDLVSGAGSGAGLADAMSHGDTMKKAGSDALKPEAYVEFQFAPNARLPLTNPPMNLTDATFFINTALTFGYKGNASFKGVGDKKILVQFQTPLTPAGALDFADFSFRMATPPNFTMEDAAQVMVAMATPDPRLAKYGGGFIRNIESFKKPLLDVLQPLSVFQLRNPTPAPEYRFGDSSKPWPDDPKYYNIALLGPLAQGGPYIRAAGEAVILGQRMGFLDASAGTSGLHGQAVQDLTLKLGPLGRVTIQKMIAQADINKDTQYIRLKGNFGGQVVEVILAGSTLTINVPANCANPFEIKTSVAIQASTNIADVFEGQGGVNVDPARLPNCVGKALEAAYNKIANEYKSLGGYSANEANAALKKISDDAAAASAKAYNEAKNQARDLANSSTSSATQGLKDAGNAISGAFGGKKKHSDANDKFDRTVFNWDYYYDTRGTAWGKTDLVQYWADQGYAAGERASYEFDLKYYRRQHPGASDKDLLNTWLKDGINRCDQSSPDFSLAALVRRYPGGSCRDNLDWWFEKGGMNSGLNGRP